MDLNICHLPECFADEQPFYFQAEMLTLTCPVCQHEYNHLDTPRLVEGHDDYKAWEGRGDLVVVPIKGECGSLFEIHFGFHKGQIAVFARVVKECDESFFFTGAGKGTIS